MALKDSGKRQEFGTGSVRDTQDGKGRYDLLPTRAIHELAQHFQHGGQKYGDRNWEQGQPLSRYLSSGLRHAFQALQGEHDENHAVAAAWNMMCFMETRARIKAGLLPQELDDLPKPPPKVSTVPAPSSTTYQCPQCAGSGNGLSPCCGHDDCAACKGRGICLLSLSWRHGS